MKSPDVIFKVLESHLLEFVSFFPFYSLEPIFSLLPPSLSLSCQGLLVLPKG